jgi:release factor glutamine methyltransferase
VKLQPDHSVSEALEIMARRLVAAGVEATRLEARMLASAVLGLDHAGLIRHETRALGAAAERAEVLLVRRCRREPLSRILGTREFFGLNFSLNPATLDPRPDTETLVEVALQRLSEAPAPVPFRLLDLGTGTGAIMLALLSRLPAAQGLGIDLAPAAVEMARENAARLGMGDRAAFQVGDLLTGLDGCYDAIVSNPPYIASAVIGTLDPEVRLFDPVLALDGGVDGLDFYRRIAGDAPARLIEGGLLALEVGAGQAAAVAELLADAGMGGIRTRKDLAGTERVVSARKVSRA